MRSRTLRFLAVACGLTLALPPGWCCLFALPSAGKAETCCRGNAGACCCPCAAPRPDTSKPGRPQRPAPLRHCPCTDRNTTLLNKVAEKVAVDGGRAAVPAICDLPREAVGAVEDVGPPTSAPPQSVRVLHCLWLC